MNTPALDYLQMKAANFAPQAANALRGIGGAAGGLAGLAGGSALGFTVMDHMAPDLIPGVADQLEGLGVPTNAYITPTDAAHGVTELGMPIGAGIAGGIVGGRLGNMAGRGVGSVVGNATLPPRI